METLQKSRWHISPDIGSIFCIPQLLYLYTTVPKTHIQVLCTVAYKLLLKSLLIHSEETTTMPLIHQAVTGCAPACAPPTVWDALRRDAAAHTDGRTYS